MKKINLKKMTLEHIVRLKMFVEVHLFGGELTKLVDSSSKYECAAGVYNYFVRYLKNDQETFSKFSQISGDARDYWNKNESLSLFSTSTQTNPRFIYYTIFKLEGFKQGIHMDMYLLLLVLMEIM